MKNNIFGKRIDNLRKTISVKLVNNAKDYVRYISKQSFVSQKIFSRNFVAVHEIKLVLTLITNTLKVNLMVVYCLQTQTV